MDNNNNNENPSYLAVYHPPIKQAAVAVGGIFVFMVLGKVFSATGAAGFDVTFPWTAAGAVYLMYSVFNSINSFTTDDMLTYYRDSIFCYIGLVAVGYGLAYLFSGVSIDEAGTFRWIYIMITMSYFGFIGIVSFIRFIFSVLQTEQEKLSKRIDD